MINQTSTYAAPDALQVSSAHGERYLLLGTCQLGLIAGHAEKVGKTVDHILASASIELPASLPADISIYKAQIISLTLRDILGEQTWDMQSGYRRLKCITEDDYKEFFAQCVERLEALLARLMKFNLSHGLTTLVLNFQTPQRNPLGILTPFYSLSNPIYFFDRLNEKLEQETLRYQNAYIINIDRLHSIYGKRYFQDDAVSLMSHNSIIDDFNANHDDQRIVPPVSTQEMYGVELHVMGDILWREIDTAMRIIARTDAVKLVIFDIDDTIWRGIAADDDRNVYERTEGWPISLVEAVRYLKTRGMMLALCSKNDLAFVEMKFKETYGALLNLNDFQSIKCNWDRKDVNVNEILCELNLLPDSVVFVDDNPMEIDVVTKRFPAIRTLGFNHYDWKRLLLWSPETQVPYITDEARSRTVVLPTACLLSPTIDSPTTVRSYELFVLHRIDSNSAHYKRLMELMNKTNQFNTTGRRWTHAEIIQFLHAGGEIDVFFARNELYDAGLIAAALHKDGYLTQWVMSCRVFGYGLEEKMISDLVFRRGVVSLDMVDTGKNGVAVAFARRYGLVGEVRSFDIPLNLLNRDGDLPNILPQGAS